MFFAPKIRDSSSCANTSSCVNDNMPSSFNPIGKKITLKSKCFLCVVFLQKWRILINDIQKESLPIFLLKINLCLLRSIVPPLSLIRLCPRRATSHPRKYMTFHTSFTWVFPRARYQHYYLNSLYARYVTFIIFQIMISN